MNVFPLAKVNTPVKNHDTNNKVYVTRKKQPFRIYM